MPKDLATEPSSPTWEAPRRLTESTSWNGRTGVTTHYIPRITPVAKALDHAARHLANLCRPTASLSDLEAFFAKWQDPANAGRLQPNALAWFDHSDVLGSAVSSGREDVVRVLLGQGLRPGEWDVFMALIAVKQGGSSKEVLSLFLEHGWEINRAVNEFTTPILGYLINNEELVQWCLSLGATPDAAGPRGYTAMQSAVSDAPLKTLQLLVAHGGTIRNTDLVAHAASAYCPSNRDRLPVIQYLLEQGAPIDTYYMSHSSAWNSVDHGMYIRFGKQNALHRAISGGEKELVQFLLERGADAKLEMFSLKTKFQSKRPVELAEMLGFEDIAILLKRWLRSVL
ncbi:MAG: hypothetical protein M1820_006405 [Bogoriella megaspora]|nr:MAG: hypothetical protein M1820_006405 [Bogoriella megaspora]